MLKLGFFLLTFLSVICINEAASLEEKGLSKEESDRRGYARCFGTIWGWMKGYGEQKFEENVISGNPDNVRFFLYSDPYNTNHFEEIVYNDPGSLLTAQYRFGQPWKILIHGYTMSQYGSFPQNVKNAYLEEYRNQIERKRDLQADGFNVILVDWAPLADPKLTGNANFFLFYAFAVRNTAVVGKRVGEFIQWLERNGALESYDQVHVIGFSLGAHVAGNSAFTVFNTTGQKLSRVTGLDPAGPNFYLGLPQISSRKLTKEDARFVDVYHSNQGAFGTMEKLGDVDFYPNGGGPMQNYCLQVYAAKQSNQTLADLGSCAHNRAPFYYAKSISSLQEPMIACACDNYNSFKNTCECKDRAVFGEYCDPRTRGVFYLDVEDP